MNPTQERLFPFVQLQPNEIAEIISPVLHATCEELNITALTGSVHSSYRVKNATRDLLIRVIHGDLNVYLKEFNFLSRYADILPLPKPIHFQLSSQASHGFSVAIHDWIEGITLDDFLSNYPERTSDAARSVGHTVAQFSKIPFPSSGFLSNDLSFDQPFTMNRDGYMSFIGGLLSDSLVAERLQRTREPIWQFVSRHSDWMNSIPASYNLVNGNFRRKNILVNPDGDGVKVVGLIDWEFAMSWTSLFDISQLLEPPFSTVQEFEKELTQAFSNGGGLIPEGWSWIKNLLQLFSWCDLLARPITPPSMQQVALERISAIVRG